MMLSDEANEFLNKLSVKVLKELREDKRFSKYTDEELEKIAAKVQCEGKIPNEFFGTAMERYLNPFGYENHLYVNEKEQFK